MRKLDSNKNKERRENKIKNIISSIKLNGLYLKRIIKGINFMSVIIPIKIKEVKGIGLTFLIFFDLFILLHISLNNSTTSFCLDKNIFYMNVKN